VFEFSGERQGRNERVMHCECAVSKQFQASPVRTTGLGAGWAAGSGWLGVDPLASGLHIRRYENDERRIEGNISD